MKFQFCILICSFCLCIIICCSCDKLKKNDEYYSNGNLKEIVLSDSSSGGRMIYLFYENGNIKAIQRFNKEGKLHGEQVWFFQSGRINKKIPISNDKASGNAYYFYDTTGALKSDRYFRNDKQVFYGADYWGDSMGTMKSSLHFNDSGQIFYKKYFDSNGKFIKEEGKRD